MSKQHKKAPKKKREKITWIDDGSTVADMSPVGKGLIGARKGDEVQVAIPAGTITLKVLDVYKA